MSDLIISLVRTWVPIGVGVVITWLATKGVVIEEEAKLGLVAGLTGVITALYYTVARVLETRWPVFGLLLGKRKTPLY